MLIEVPFSDLSVVKRRPVLILSSDKRLQLSPDMLVATITSNLNAGMMGVVFDTADMEASTLPRRSLIQADKIHNLSQAEIIKMFGVLNKITFEKVLTKIDDVLGR